MSEKCDRYIVLLIQNETIRDDTWNPLLIETLREYADMVEKKHAGHEGIEKFFAKNGNKLTVIANTWYGTLLPDTIPGLADKACTGCPDCCPSDES